MIIAQILCILVLAKLIVSEYVAPWRPATSDLRLKPTQVREVSHIRVCECEIALYVAVDAFGDCRQVQVVPGREVITTAVVTVSRAGVGRSKRVGEGLRNIGLENINIPVGRVGA